MTEDMANFKILLTPWHGTPIAPPYIDSTFTEEIKSKNPYNNPVYSNDWFNYSPMRAGKRKGWKQIIIHIPKGLYYLPVFSSF